MSQLSVLSMGWGVQSWTLAAMMALDEIPRVDYIVHADTGHELASTYEFAAKWGAWLGERGLNVVTVAADNVEPVRTDWGKRGSVVMIPAFTRNESGSKGQVRRQCTDDWKIAPIRRFIRAKLKELNIAQSEGVVAQVLGISLDEWSRMRTSGVKYITNTYPLVDRRISRSACMHWLEQHDLPVPAKSGCTFCPYRKVDQWRELKRRGGSDWNEAVIVDNLIRHSINPGSQAFLHSSAMPLEQAVSIPEDFGASQLELEGCEGGHCWT